jgi:hypothetical protein
MIFQASLQLIFISNHLIPQISPQLTDKLLLSMPNHYGTIAVNGTTFPISFMELSKPTGKYVYRVFIKLFNLFGRKGYIRIIGNACAPGITFPNLTNIKTKELLNNTENNCGVLIANVLGHEKYEFGSTIPAEPFMVIYLNDNLSSIQDYLQLFSSKYRVRAQKVLKNSNAIISKPLHDLPPNDWISQCGKLLYHSLQDKTIAIGQNLSQLIHCFQKSLGSNFKVFGYYLDGKIVGFISFIQDNNIIHATHLGIDMQLPLSYSLYQRMMYDLVSYSIENKITFINLGRTATEIKSTIGAVPIENSFIIFTKSPILHFINKFYTKYIHKNPEFILRNPFKN